MTDAISIDITPTFRGLLPILLAAHANMERKLTATECDGQREDWCSIHEREYVRPSDTVCSFFHDLSGAEQSEWRRSLSADYASNKKSFEQMADLADRLGRLVKSGRLTLEEVSAA